MDFREPLLHHLIQHLLTDAVGGAGTLSVAHIRFADVFHTAVAVPVAVDGHKGRSAFAAGEQTSVPVVGRIALLPFATLLLEQWCAVWYDTP